MRAEGCTWLSELPNFHHQVSWGRWLFSSLYRENLSRLKMLGMSSLESCKNGEKSLKFAEKVNVLTWIKRNELWQNWKLRFCFLNQKPWLYQYQRAVVCMVSTANLNSTILLVEGMKVSALVPAWQQSAAHLVSL